MVNKLTVDEDNWINDVAIDYQKQQRGDLESARVDIARDNPPVRHSRATPEQLKSLKDAIDDAKRRENQEKEFFDTMDIGVQAVGGLRDAVESVKNLGIDIGLAGAELAIETFTDIEVSKEDKKEVSAEQKKKTKLPRVPDPKSRVSSFVRPITQFLAPFSALAKVGKVAGLVTGAKTAAATGFIADFISFEEHEKRLSDLIESVPGLKNPVSSYLKSDKTDTFIEGRLKNGIEGLGLGVMTNAIFKGIRYIKQVKDQKKLGAQTRSEINKELESVRISAKEISDNIDKLRTENVPQTVKAQQAKAKKLGVTVEDLVSGKLLVKAKSAKTKLIGIAANRLQENAFEKMQFAAAKYADLIATGDKKAVDDFFETVREFELISARAKDITSEPARLLQERGTLASTQFINDLNGILEVSKPKDREAFALVLSDRLKKGDRGYINIVRDLNKNKDRFTSITDALYATRAGHLLSSPKSIVRDTLGNVIMSGVISPSERVIASGIGKARNIADTLLFKNGKADDRVYIDEVSQYFESMYTSFKDGFTTLTDTFAAQEGNIFSKISKTKAGVLDEAAKKALNDRTKFDEVTTISGDVVGLGKNSTLGRFLDMAGLLSKKTLGFYRTKDDIVKPMVAKAEQRALAVRRAKGELLTGKPFDDRVAELTKNPLDYESMRKRTKGANFSSFSKYMGDLNDPEFISLDLDMRAVAQAEKDTFTNQLGVTAQKASELIEVVPFGRLIVPFRKSTANIMSRSVERTPLAPVFREVRSDLAAGGARRDMALARMSFGTGVGVVTAGLTFNGDMVGDFLGQDKAVKQTFARTGIMRNSLIMGDESIEMQGLEPFTTFVSLGANIAEISMLNQDILDPVIEGRNAELATLLTVGLAKSLLSKTYAQGIVDLVDVVTSENPARIRQYKAKMVASTVVPRLIPFIANTIDPIRREAETIMQAISKDLGINRGNLPEYLDIWGEPTTVKKGIPVAHSNIEKDGFDAELLAQGVYISPPAARTSIEMGGGLQQQLTRKQYNLVLKTMKHLGVKERVQNVFTTFKRLADQGLIATTVISGVPTFEGLTLDNIVTREYSQIARIAKATVSGTLPFLSDSARELSASDLQIAISGNLFNEGTLSKIDVDFKEERSKVIENIETHKQRAQVQTNARGVAAKFLQEE